MVKEIGFGAATKRMVEEAVDFAQLLDEDGYPDFIELSGGKFLKTLRLQSILKLLAGDAVGQVLHLREGIEFIEALNSHNKTLIVQSALLVLRLHLAKVLHLNIAHELFKLMFLFKSTICFRQYF